MLALPALTLLVALFILRTTHLLTDEAWSGSPLAEPLLDRLPRHVSGLRYLHPRSALCTSLLDRSALNLLQDSFISASESRITSGALLDRTRNMAFRIVSGGGRPRRTYLTTT